MSQLFALEWDSREIRLMVASGRGRQVVIEQALSIPCEVDISEPNAAEQIGRRIATELDDRGLGRGEVVVAVGRNNIELRQLQLPPAPDEDLPDMVRFQATREFNELDDKWLLDFIPIEGSESTPRTVLATAIAPAVLGQIEAVCEHAGLKMRRLLLRPCEAASLLESEKSIPRGQSALLVCPLGGEADLTAVIDGVAVFLRTTRIASDPPPLQAMLAEIRLTMAAASNQLGGRRIESIVLCGHQQVHLDLARSIETELGIHVELFDPLGGVKLGRALVQSPPQHPGRFAPLVGMLLAELTPSTHAVDFLHPRRRAERPDNRKIWVAAGVAVSVLLLAWIIYLRIDHSRLVGAVNDLSQRSKSLDEALTRADAKGIRSRTVEIAKVVGDEVIWLDRLYDLNQSFPTAEDAVVAQLTVNSTIRGGQIDLKGSVRKQDVIARLQEKIGTHGEIMTLRGSSENRTDSPYPLSFDAFVHPKTSEKP
jgi:Tfp pilus assembly PilM family ATPase